MNLKKIRKVNKMIEKLDVKYEDVKEISENGINSSYEHKLWEKVVFYPFILIEMMVGFVFPILMYYTALTLPFGVVSVISEQYLKGIPFINEIAPITGIIASVVFVFLAWAFREKMVKIEREMEICDEFNRSISEDISNLNNLIESPNEKLYRKFEFIDINNSSEEKIAINIPNGYKEHKISSDNENIQLLDDICSTDKASESELIDMIKAVGEYHYNARVDEEIKRKNKFVEHKTKMQYVSNESNEQTCLKRTIGTINESNEQWQQELKENLLKENIKL